jgi:hypothetical protein
MENIQLGTLYLMIGEYIHCIVISVGQSIEII